MRMRSLVREETWQAFWRTSVDEVSIGQVADELGLSVGAVQIARSRVRGRLQEAVKQFEQWDSEQTCTDVRESGELA